MQALNQLRQRAPCRQPPCRLTIRCLPQICAAAPFVTPRGLPPIAPASAAPHPTPGAAEASSSSTPSRRSRARGAWARPTPSTTTGRTGRRGRRACPERGHCARQWASWRRDFVPEIASKDPTSSTAVPPLNAGACFGKAPLLVRSRRQSWNRLFAWLFKYRREKMPRKRCAAPSFLSYPT